MWEGAVLWGAMAMIAYGTINAVATVTGLFRSLRQLPGVAYLVLVQNQEERVEGLVRSLAGEADGELLLVDLGSADDSPAILERLAADLAPAQFFRFGATERSQALRAALRATEAPMVVLIDMQENKGEKGKT